MIARVIYFFVFLISALVFPWWVTLFAGAMGMLLFPLYFEALFMALFLDALYGGSSISFLPDFPVMYSCAFMVLFFFLEFLKTKVQYF
ncbi:MAG TPA: hypothetical protein VFM02_03705 [Candidatus Paceibacterota bacterium]|nr:hypothetical protein [Candidatus Paceibacterota bacterium]